MTVVNSQQTVIAIRRDGLSHGSRHTESSRQHLACARARLYVLALLLAALILGTAAPARAQMTGVAEGTVVNGTSGAHAAGLPVKVQVFERMTLLEERRVTTDAEGWFRTDGLPAGADNRYIVSVEYAGLSYKLDQAINPALAQEPVVFTVYETMASAEAVSILSASMAITSIDPTTALMQVLEVITVANRSNVAYVGDLLSDPEKGGVIMLPLGGPALDIELGDGFTEMPRATATKLTTTTPAFPGETVLVYAYKLPYQGAGYQIERAFDLPVERSSFLIAAGGPKAVSKELGTSATVDINGKLNASLSGKGFASGQKLVVSLTGLPPIQMPASSGGGVSLDTILRGTSIALMALALVAVALYSLARRRKGLVPAIATSSENDALTAQRAALVKSIADLDDRFQVGVISRQHYEDARTEMKRRLTEVVLLLQETRGVGR